MLQVATCSSCITTRSQFCLLLEDGGSSLSSLGHLALDSSAHCFLLICIAARQQLVKSFFSFLTLLLVSCLPWVVLPWLLCLLCTASTSATSWAAVLLLLFGIVLMHSVIYVFSSFFVLLTYLPFISMSRLLLSFFSSRNTAALAPVSLRSLVISKRVRNLLSIVVKVNNIDV